LNEKKRRAEGAGGGLRVAAVQLAARWGDVDAQLGRVEALLASGPEADLVLLPEASLTGYLSLHAEADLGCFAEPLAGETTERLAGIARRHRVWLGGPLIEREGGNVYNSMLVMSRDGEVVARYRKRHPWFPETWATPGEEPLPLVDVEGTCVTIATCFDVHFLEEESAAELDAAEVLLFPSAWVEERDSREEMLAGLARRHQLAIVNANWGVGIPPVAGQGGSLIVSAHGEIVARGAAGEGRIDARLACEGP
jgi:predicted amidohydrolase